MSTGFYVQNGRFEHMTSPPLSLHCHRLPRHWIWGEIISSSWLKIGIKCVQLSTSKICRLPWLGLLLPKHNFFALPRAPGLCNSRWDSISSSQATLFSALDNKTMSWRGERPLLEPQTCALLDESHGVLDHLPVQGVDLLEGEGDHPVPPSEPRSIQVTTPIYKA